MMIDPRLTVLQRRYAKVQRIIGVTGGKGGIGKSLTATTLALEMAAGGERIGLFDLDFTGPCDHLILGHACSFPTEQGGVLPPLVAGIKLMSVAHFAPTVPTPLRGDALTSALTELLCITVWGELDWLVLDLPPGLGDTILDVLAHLPQAEFLVVSTPSLLVRETVRRTLSFLCQCGCSVLGVVENMARTSEAAGLAVEAGVPDLGRLPFDPELDGALGCTERLRQTDFAAAVRALCAGPAFCRQR